MPVSGNTLREMPRADRRGKREGKVCGGGTPAGIRAREILEKASGLEGTERKPVRTAARIRELWRRWPDESRWQGSELPVLSQRGWASSRLAELRSTDARHSLTNPRDPSSQAI